MATLSPKMAAGQLFTELDLSHAYEQMLVDENSREFLTINTRHLPENHGGFAARNTFDRSLAR